MLDSTTQTVPAASAQVRTGTPADLDEVMRLGLLAAEENGLGKPNVGKILEKVWSALAQGAARTDGRSLGIIGVVGGAPGSPLEGFILLEVGAQWYSDDTVIEERIVYVHPDHRSGRLGRARMLTDFGKQVADRIGAPLLIGVLSNARTEAKVRLYERSFGPPAGAFFLYNGHTGAADGR